MKVARAYAMPQHYPMAALCSTTYWENRPALPYPFMSNKLALDETAHAVLALVTAELRRVDCGLCG